MGGDLNELNINELQALEAKMDSSLLAIRERKEDDGSDSLSVQLVDEKHWEDLFIVIAVSYFKYIIVGECEDFDIFQSQDEQGVFRESYSNNIFSCSTTRISLAFAYGRGEEG
ncbi:uncharacterized protein LOC105784484 isoform X2 [Gossypium raimondii]|uniref:uncharacterized protein LOC105784484 isoform X2 n=1 Tax=Gossypium raimondii TaxID=29730 RepID=UPI00227B4D3E|nr:uncharacterized protein LOC105784484 isoform X2 [Gossypium raimondii]